MSKTLIAVSGVNPALLALKPRQLLLSLRPTMKHDNNGDEQKRALLLQAVARFLERNSFSKTLKKFRSEAHVEKGSSEASSLDLEEMYDKYLKICNGTVTNNKQDTAAVETAGKKKKKSEKIDSDVGTDELTSSKNSKETVLGDEAEDLNGKLKEKKKKSKKLSEQESREVKEKPTDKTVPESVEEPNQKSRVKKNKKGNTDSESVPDLAVEKKEKKSKTKVTSLFDGSEKDDTKTSSEDKENKVSNKRKRVDSDENDKTKSVDIIDSEDSKRRKTEGYLQSKGEDQYKSIETPVKQFDGQENGNLDKSGDKFSKNKSSRKQQNGSAEPKSANAFQRVKVEKVEFADEKLQDNSYWAKDGAEIGYGAKAQEVLGQVRGRDFRHEKTKKKRGSYRGGMIDLQSHSVKFNYSDDE